MKTKLTVLLILVAAALTPAQTTTKPKAGSRLMEMFQKLDMNGDGKLSREEGRLLPNFAEIDQDQDGFLTPQEIATFYKPKGSTVIPPSLLTRDAIDNDRTPPFPSPDPAVTAAWRCPGRMVSAISCARG